MSGEVRKPPRRRAAAIDPVSARVLHGFCARVAFFIGIDMLVALADPQPLVRFLSNLRTLFSIAAILSTLLGLLFRQRLQGPTLTCFDEAIAFLGLQILAGATLQAIRP